MKECDALTQQLPQDVNMITIWMVSCLLVDLAHVSIADIYYDPLLCFFYLLCGQIIHSCIICFSVVMMKCCDQGHF